HHADLLLHADGEKSAAQVIGPYAAAIVEPYDQVAAHRVRSTRLVDRAIPGDAQILRVDGREQSVAQVIGSHAAGEVADIEVEAHRIRSAGLREDAGPGVADNLVIG